MFDLCALQHAVAQHHRVARVVIASTKGSSPREVGASMLVWANGQSGTIGGGALEWQATLRARAMLETGGTRLDHEALGPKLNQCCGGSVSVLTEIYDAHNLPNDAVVIARAVDRGPIPLSVQRLISRSRNQGVAPAPQMIQGWMVEPIAKPARALWIWGAGHVGRALVDVIAPLPEFSITWVDTGLDRFPEQPQTNVMLFPVARPEEAVGFAPQTAEHLILTYSHSLDLELCHRILGHGFASCGLIGSATKWARFRGRLGGLGHDPFAIARIDCPIGDPSLGKHPHAIAIGVARHLLARVPARTQLETTGT